MKESPNIPARPIGQRVQDPHRGTLSTRRQEFAVPPPKRSHWIVFLVVCCLLGLLVFKTVLHVISTDTRKARLVHSPSPVETVPVRSQTLEEVIGGSGTVQQFNTVLLTTQITARVLEVPVWIGDIVKRGDLLVRWDDRLIRATLDANRQFVETSKIKIKNETLQVERYTALAKQHMGTPLDLEKAQIALADAQEQLAKATMGLRGAEIALERVQMRAPIEAIVLERLVNPDEITHNDQIVMKLGAIDPNTDPVTRTFTAYIQIKNPGYRLKPGLSGFAHIQRTAKDVIAVPSVAIMNPSGDQASVFVVDRSGRATPRKINLGIVVNAMTEVTSGLNEGEKVVTVGQLYLKENDKVQSTSKSNFGK